ncbi:MULTISPECIES: aldehyde dehydrogenase family protein [unclassified Marinobacter]|uniref:aldehyde dehydrogenase family protein n=1 Tax=unclassified Marinobacter TaxID=83889 RepID=UPI000BF743C8|nr:MULTISPECIES: aldehyde dehydrogenase family protein [unclassified Marinobacter]PFG10601.1 aldehyde dehydrogenase (NAD+) [Marinobacter sp. LV10MA510-1]PFG52520.1 aldehyde dehydrogenase (NAD+) [Marinobacter sp. LV10R520-4]
MTERYRDFHLQLLAGEWREGCGEESRPVQNPYSGETLTTIRSATSADLDAAYQKAAEAQIAWADTPPAERSALMLGVLSIFDERKDEIIDWLIYESGSTRLKANIEWGSARAITQEAASMPARAHGATMASNIPGKDNLVFRRPLGVVGVISPWNFPLHLSQRSVAPALALGNAVVIKPASDTPITGGLLLAHIFAEAGLPAGLLSVVVGPGSEIGDDFVAHPIPALISFTGSTPVGKNIGKLATGGSYLKKVALELGGNSPFVVLEDADVGQAVKAAIFGKFLHQGQICMAINRIIVDQRVYDRFVEEFVAHAGALNVGDPSAMDTAIGPVINKSQLEGLQQKIAKAKEQGAKVLLEGDIHGQMVPPHVFGDVTPDMEISREEIFGPLIGIQKARNEEHALELANNTEFGLSSAVFCGDLYRGLQFARKVRAGMTHVNDMPVNDEAHTPFGGDKNSGLGRFNGDWAIDEFTSVQWVSVQREPRQYPF